MGNSITIEDTVARMVNVGEIPLGVPLLDYLDAIVKDAEDKYEQAKAQDLPLDLLDVRVKASNSRFELASYLKQHIEWELDTPSKESILKRSPDSYNTQLLELKSVAEWASFHYGIDRLDYEELNNTAREVPTNNAIKNAEKIAKNGLTPILAKLLYVTFAYALEELVATKKNPIGFGTAENINVLQTAELLYNRATNTKNYDTEILKNRIETAIAMKKLYLVKIKGNFLLLVFFSYSKVTVLSHKVPAS
jgi:hypothetical protein